ncbi:MAG: helix-hairpin-helix domain-containing protein [candidate division KSB1 bacterium]|nr:helix-hairpin-helix domain-containing protein [candidate division KSB1 bacterium]
MVLAVTLMIGLGVRWYQIRQPLPQVDPSLSQRFQAIADSLNDLSGQSSRLTRRERQLWNENQRININEAGKEELMRLPGIGETLAERIIKRRQNRGPFRRESDLLYVSGIGPKTLSKIRPYITVKD